MEEADEHVISIDDYEFRAHGREQDLEADPDVIRFSDDLAAIERGWDWIVGNAGLEAVSTYVPFHQDVPTYGIYLSQRGIRYLGHLLYQWSRVEALGDSSADATAMLQTHDLSDGSRLYDGQPQFESVEAAFDRAREFLLRYQWFHHQFELPAAYVEDSRDQVLYPRYFEQEHATPSDSARNLASTLAIAYVAHSRACQDRAPSSLFRPLFWRTIASVSPSLSDVRTLLADDEFSKGCRELSGRLFVRSADQPSLDGVEIARRLPFSTDLRGTAPNRISVFITRRESDPDNGSYATNEFPLSVEWKVNVTDGWEAARDRADGSVQDAIERREEIMRDDPRRVTWKGKGIGPSSVYYANLTKDKRFVFKIDRQNKEVVLKDFGDHDLPKEYGLHVN